MRHGAQTGRNLFDGRIEIGRDGNGLKPDRAFAVAAADEELVPFISLGAEVAVAGSEAPGETCALAQGVIEHSRMAQMIAA